MAFRLILLDRNALDTVKNSVCGQKVEPQRLSRLRGVDKQRNLVSPILSIIEGQSGRRESTEELHATLKKESEAIGRFFKRARTDAGFFSNAEHSKMFIDVFSKHIENSWGQYISFVNDVQILIYQPVSARERFNIEKLVFKLAHVHGVQVTHPVFLVSLAVLYGHDGARKVLKPKSKYISTDLKQRAAYNVVSDLMVLSRIGIIRSALTENEKKFGYVKFFTFDKGLSSVLNVININSEKSFSSGEVSISVTCDRSLFPHMDNENLDRLYNALSTSEENKVMEKSAGHFLLPFKK